MVCSGMQTVDEIVQFFRSRARNVACDGANGLLGAMETLGFKYSEGKAGHRIFTHAQLTKATDGAFTTHSINCDHRTNKPMPPVYVRNTLKLIEKYAFELREINGEKPNV